MAFSTLDFRAGGIRFWPGCGPWVTSAYDTMRSCEAEPFGRAHHGAKYRRNAKANLEAAIFCTNRHCGKQQQNKRE